MTGQGTTSEGKTITSLETAFDIIELVAENEGMTSSELSERLDYSRSTIHYYLTTLEKHRFLTREDEGYRIGFRFLHYGNRALERHDLTGSIEQEVEKLARETGATALFAVQQQGRCVFIHQSSAGGDSNGRFFGMERYLHCTSFGRVLLAHLPERTMNEIIERHGLPAAEPGAITDREKLMDELATIRDQKFAYEQREYGQQICSIAAPVVRNRETEPVGAIGIVGEDEEIADPRHIKAQRFAEKPVTMVKRHAQILRNKIDE